jgi:hypothetical protein
MLAVRSTTAAACASTCSVSTLRGRRDILLRAWLLVLLQHGRPWAHVYLDSGPFYTDACQVLRNTWTQLWTYDGSRHATNYRHSREGYEDQVADVALLPEALMNENGEPNDDVVTVYRLHLEDAPASDEEA